MRGGMGMGGLKRPFEEFEGMADGMGFGSFKKNAGYMTGPEPIDPALEGRKLKVQNVPDALEDMTITRYFKRFGEVITWSRKTMSLIYQGKSMADYALRKTEHTIDGHKVKVERAEPNQEEDSEDKAG